MKIIENQYKSTKLIENYKKYGHFNIFDSEWRFLQGRPRGSGRKAQIWNKNQEFWPDKGQIWRIFPGQDGCEISILPRQ